MNTSSFPVSENECLSVNLHVSFHPLELFQRSAAEASALDSTAADMHHLHVGDDAPRCFTLRDVCCYLYSTDQGAEIS